MKKPTDPRKHGLKHPQKVIVDNRWRDLASGFDYPQIETILAKWEEIKKEISENNLRLASGAFVRGNSICYSTLSDNKNYEAELKIYNEAIDKYYAELKVFEEYKAAEKQRCQISQNGSLDDKIRIAKERLARLEAQRDQNGKQEN